MTTDSRIGTDLAGYRIEAKVGQGGMGVVYRAEQTRLGRKVALKVLTPELAENAGFRERFEHESRLAAAIDHPNIVPLYEAGETDGLLFITMRYVEGTDLKALIQRAGRLQPRRALEIAGQVASALDTAHARGLVHRDVKPGNILVAEGAGSDGHDHCYLTDFGLTKDTASPVELTATGTFVGTLDYVAPEQIEGTGPDGRSDEYSLCCVLWECLVGTPPFVRDSEIAVMWAHLQDHPPKLSDALPGLPPALDAVIAKGLAKSPQDRYETCAAMVTAARRELEGRAPRAPAPETVVRTTPAAETPPAPATAPSATPPPAPSTVQAARSPAPPLVPGPAVPESAVPAPTPAVGDAAHGDQTTAGAAVRPPVAPAAPARPRGRRLAGIAVGAAVIAAAVAGWLAGGTDDDGATAQTVNAGAISFARPASWEQGEAAAIPGARLQSPIALGSEGANLTAGRLTAPGAALLPDALVARLPGRTAPRGEGVALGSIAALRFKDLHPRGSRGTRDMYVIPTDAGTMAIACSAADRTTLAQSGCDGVAATLGLSGAKPLPLAPGAAYGKALSQILRGLASSRTDRRRTLAKASSSAAQSSAAAQLSDTYGRLERRANRLTPPAVARRANRAVVAALGDGRRAYDELAVAAKQRDAADYAAARRAVRRADARLRRALAAHAALGYRTAG